MKQIFNLACLTSLALVVPGCAQLGFFSVGDYFDRSGPAAVKLDCSAPANAPDGQAARPAGCDKLDSATTNYRSGNYASAESEYKESIESFTASGMTQPNADMRKAWFGLAAVYDLQGRFSDADRIYKYIYTSFGGSLRYYNNYGYSLFLRKDYAGARAQWQEGLKSFPDNESLLQNLASLPDSGQPQEQNTQVQSTDVTSPIQGQ